MKFLTACLAMLLTGCAISDVQKIGKVDATEKTILIGHGGGLVTQAIKSELETDGWKVMLDNPLSNNPTARKGRESRYSMNIHAAMYDREFPTMKILYQCEVAVFDNKTGEQIAVVNGEGTEAVLGRQVRDVLR